MEGKVRSRDVSGFVFVLNGRINSRLICQWQQPSGEGIIGDEEKTPEFCPRAQEKRRP